MMHMPSHPAPSMLASTPLALVASASTWHQRLDHPGVGVLSKLSHDSSVICSRNTHDRCHACQLGRHIRLPFVSSNSCADNNFDLIHPIEYLFYLAWINGDSSSRDNVSKESDFC
jgi:hypothetical protein